MRAPRHRTTRAFATATFGLRLALRLFEKTNNNDYSYFYSIESTVACLSTSCGRDSVQRKLLLTAPTFASMTSGPNRWLALLSCSQRKVQLRHQSSVREGEGVVVIKFLGLVRVDVTHQSTALDISLFTHFKWTTSYVDIFYFVCSHLLKSLKRLIFRNGGSTTHACMP